jgi:hypothetical protein
MNLGIAAIFAQLAIVFMIFNSDAAKVIALVPLLVDIGYFVAADLPELGAISSQVQTYIISIAMICVATFTFRNSDMGAWYLLTSIPFWTMATGLFSAGILNKIAWALFEEEWKDLVIHDGSADYQDAIFL